MTRMNPTACIAAGAAPVASGTKKIESKANKQFVVNMYVCSGTVRRSQIVIFRHSNHAAWPVGSHQQVCHLP